MVIAVKIKNRKTGEYRTKGWYCCWNKLGKSWIRLRDAKLAVCPDHWYCNQYGDFIKAYQKELESDFIVFNDDGTSKIIPVAQYFIERLTRETDGGYGSDRAERALKEVKQYCKDNNIEIKEEKYE